MKIHVILLAWGESYVTNLLRSGLASLMSPGNLPAIAAVHDVCFKLYTTPVDAKRLHGQPIIERLKRMMRLDFVDIDTVNVDEMEMFKVWKTTPAEYKYKRMSGYHLHAMTAAFAEDAALIFSAPEALISDGFGLRVNDAIKQGKRALLFNHLSVSEETFLPALNAAFPPGADGSWTLPPRELTAIALAHRAPWLAPWFVKPEGFDISSQLYWEVEGEGFLAHAFHLSPLFIHPQRLPTKIFWSVDNNYTLEVIDNLRDMVVIQDSDDVCFLDVAWVGVDFRNGRKGSSPYNVVLHALDGIELFVSPHNDDWVRQPIRWHGADIPEHSPSWHKAEVESAKFVDDLLAWTTFFREHPNAARAVRPLTPKGQAAKTQTANQEVVAARLRGQAMMATLSPQGRARGSTKVDPATAQKKIEGLTGLTHLFLALVRTPEVLQSLIELTKLNPSDVESWVTLARAAEQLGSREVFALAVDEVRRLEPRHPILA